ncbi:MAG: hypothetical protein JJU36_12085 [Phycisphaeraceae bacterium]|nr:hypothetical protein [Phycisphaeraceae bacterium]
MSQVPPPPPPGSPRPDMQPRSSGMNPLIIVVIVIGGGAILLAVIALMIGILLPALGSARATANRLAEAADLRLIGSSLGIYHAQHGRFPDHVGRLTTMPNGIDPELFLGRQPGQPPEYRPDMPGGPAYKFGNLYFVFEGVDARNANSILAFGQGRGSTRGGHNVLYADGRVEFLSPLDLQLAVERENERRRSTGQGQPIDLDTLIGGVRAR